MKLADGPARLIALVREGALQTDDHALTISDCRRNPLHGNAVRLIVQRVRSDLEVDKDVSALLAADSWIPRGRIEADQVGQPVVVGCGE